MKRIIPLFLIALSLIVTTSCTQMMSCVINNVYEPQLVGPFLNVPDVQDNEREPDAISSSSEALYFLWINPEMENNDAYRCEILTQTVEGLDEGIIMGSADGVAASGNFRGPIMFAAPPNGWLPGSYEAMISRNSITFDSISFTIRE